MLAVPIGDSAKPAMTAHYLDTLNPEQRSAVEHGAAEPSPLLVIAGAGSGKTNTLAHRVAHLIVQGADPAPDPADDVFAAGRVRDDPAGRTDRAQGAWATTPAS